MKKGYLFAIVLIATTTIFTRFTGLSQVPPHLSNDEISIAYDAYSISKTLRDEHNDFLPISFQSHGTYKAPLTIYLASIPTFLLGNSEYSVRLPSAILGSLSVFLLGFLVYELSKNKNLALITSSLLAISPWHIYTSRMVLESNVALFFVIGGLYLFFYARSRNKTSIIIVSFLFFVLSMYAYHTEWGLTPLLIGVLFYLYRKELYGKKAFFIGLLLFFLLITPLFRNYLNNRGTYARANTQLLFRDPGLEKRLTSYPNDYLTKSQILLESSLGSYSSYINLGYLFFDGLSLLPKTNPFQVGLFLAPLLPSFIFGFFRLKKYFKKNANFIYLWVIFSPLVPTLTTGGANSVRNLASVAPYLVVTAVGFLETFLAVRERKVLRTIYATIILTSFIYFSAIYFYHFPKENGENFQYGYKQISLYIKPRYNLYNKIVVDPKFGETYLFDGVPHLYIPYFTYLDPTYLQRRTKDVPCGHCFAKYEIRSIHWESEKIQTKYLYIVPYSNRPPDNIEKQLSMLNEIHLPNQKPAFRIYEKIQ